MAYTVRRVQNRTKKETNEVKLTELRELRSENQKLKRENARLKKDIARESSREPPIEEDEVSLAETESKGIIIPSGNVCPNCRSQNLTIIPAGPKVITACKECSWRKAT